MHRKRKSAVLFRFVTFSSTRLLLFPQRRRIVVHSSLVNGPPLQTIITNVVIQLYSIAIEYISTERRKNMETPAGAKASVRPRSALAHGGSPAARGKRSVFP